MCHGSEGKGSPALSAARRQPVDHDDVAGQLDPHGAERRLSARHAEESAPHGMPPFAHILNDDEVAAVVTYIRVAWENSGTPVTPAQVNALRRCCPNEGAT
jgi:mono/diheme cytochrome c family protein